jgi:hypothetical protein
MGNLCSQLQVHDPETYHQVVDWQVRMTQRPLLLLVICEEPSMMQSGWEQPAGVVTLEPARSSGYGDSSPTRQSNVSLCFRPCCSELL